jgi:TolA-binding protein
MKRFVSHTLVFLALGCTFTALCSAQQTLGDAAREARKNKPSEPTTKVITNDDFGRPWASMSDDSSNAGTNSEADKDKDKDKEKEKKKTSAEEQADLDKQWKDKIAAQNEKIAILERELDVLQRENRLRSSNYYGDAGNRLRNPQKYADDDRKYRDDIAAKQKAISDAKTELENMQEEARKAGASAR